MKARVPKHREFEISFREGYDRIDECWEELENILKEYQRNGGSIYTPTFIEDNEEKVKALQEKYEFTYSVVEK